MLCRRPSLTGTAPWLVRYLTSSFLFTDKNSHVSIEFIIAEKHSAFLDFMVTIPVDEMIARSARNDVDGGRT